MSLPYLDIKDADIFEPVEMLTRGYSDTSHTVTLTLIKIRLLLELQNLKSSEIIGKKVPKEVLDKVQGELLGHAIWINPRRKEIMENEKALEDLIVEVRRQIIEIHRTVNEANRHFWPALLKPGRHLTAPLAAYSRGSVQEMQLYLQYCYYAWIETPGAVEIVHDLENGLFKA